MSDFGVECSECGSHFALGPNHVTDGLACPECGGKRLFRSQPSPTQSDGTLRDMVDSDTQRDQGGNPLGEGTIVGRDGEQPYWKRDNFMHGHVAEAGISAASVTEKVEMTPTRTLNMEPYPMGLDESYLPKTAGPLAELAAPLIEDVAAPAAEDLAGGAADAAGGAADAAGGLWDKAKGLAGGIAENPAVKALQWGHRIQQAGDFAGHLMKNVLGIGQQAGSMAPDVPTPAPSMMSYGSQDVPMLLVADLETPDSNDKLGDNDDPDKDDQKQFNDGDKNPSNHENPNNADSGASGEDNVGAGFGPNSPGLERMLMVLPLLLHYYESPESGEQDPIIKALHDTLESENPGYLNHDSPTGKQALDVVLQQHKQPRGVHAGVNAFPGGLPGGGMMPGGQMQQPGNGPTPDRCTNCGAPTAADGSCPSCGYKQGPQGGAVPAQGQASVPPGRMANHQGPVTPEQIAAVQQLLIRHHRVAEVPNVPLHPEQYAHEMAEIQKSPNVAPQPDPNDITPPPQMQQAPPGAMPVPDPSQPGGGGMPLQPMAKTRLAEMPNPVLLPDADQHQRSQHGEHDPSMQWVDNSGQPLTENQIYELHSPAYPVPDIIQIVRVKPDAIDVKLVGEVSNMDDGQPDFSINRQEAQIEHYTFVPSQDGQGIDQRNDEPPQGTTPGLDQVPPSGQTTDEYTNSNPNLSNVTAALAANEDIPEPDEDSSCTKCGSTMVDDTMSSPETTMHECVRCGNVWESRDDWQGREASADLSWILHSSNGGDDFFSDMERARAMATAGEGQSRNLASIAAKDERLQAIKERLDAAPKFSERMAGRHFSPSERRELIDEHGHARNLDELDLRNTHYDARVDYSGKANGENVPDEHLILGL